MVIFMDQEISMNLETYSTRWYLFESRLCHIRQDERLAFENSYHRSKFSINEVYKMFFLILVMFS